MSWKWDQSSGKMTRNGIEFVGYSGAELGKNNPAMQDAQGVGPIPEGLWTIGAPYTSPNTGPYTLALTPDAGTDTLGRSAFRIHGDSIAHPGTASRGCVVLPRAARIQIWESGDHRLEVVA